MGQYIVHRSDSDHDDDILCHHGVLGMKWGVRRNRQKKSKSRKKRVRKNNKTMGLDNRQERSYEAKVRAKIEEYNKQHPERSKKDNYTIALRKEQRKLDERFGYVGMAGVLTTPLFGLGVPLVIGAGLVAEKKNNTIKSIMDEYNIEGAERKIEL